MQNSFQSTTIPPCLRRGLLKRALQKRGLTLIELLVVMVILSVVTVATIPLMQPPSGDRKIREAARNVATTLELARARATETGRPAGVWFEPQAKGPNGEVEAYKLFLCDVPPPYSGDTTSATAKVENNGAQVTLSNSGSASSLVKYGDRIRFNYRGPYYRITGGTDGNNVGGTLSIAVNAAPDYSPPPANGNYPFEIMRQPVKSSITPTILTTNAPASVVDLSQSGVGNDSGASGHATAFGHGNNGLPVIITFTPAGPVYQIAHYDGATIEMDPPSSTIYFLVRLRKETYNPLNEFDSFWVSINPFTGLVTVSANGGGGSITSSRVLAIQNRMEGGL